MSEKEYATGLPDKSKKGSINQRGPTRLVIQQHKATTDHYDMRLQDGDKAHSWVIRSLPGKKDKTLALRQPEHTSKYMDFEGNIESGYGAGSVEKVLDKKVIITDANDKKIHLVIPNEDEITMVKTKYSPDSWLMIKHNPRINPVSSKPKYKVIDKPSDFSDDSKVIQPKVDGAHSIFHFKSNGLNRIYSYRNRKKDDKPIEHTHQLPEIRDMNVPKELNNTILRGEVYATKDGKPVAAEKVGGMLNASILNSLEKQKEEGKLKPYIFDIVKYHGKDVEREPYKEKLSLIRRISDLIPGLTVAETAETSKEKKKMLELIKNNKHPDTKEGIVEWDLNSSTGNPKKLKLRDDRKVIIREIYQAKEQATGKPKQEAGGFKYSWTPKGKIVGNVGTGFSKKERKSMWKNPENYIDRIARVKTQEIFSSGAMRAPSFYSLDVEKNLMKKTAELTKLAAIIMEKKASLQDFRSLLFSDLMVKLAQPTPAQAEAGNYKKKHIRYNGMEISIENPAGSVRKGIDKDGREWKSKMYHHYGYIRGSVGRDKDHIDVFIKPGTKETEKVFIINQVGKDGKFDEHKCMLGFSTKDEAIKAYLKNYEKGWKVGPTATMTIFSFKKWVYKGRKMKPAKTELKKVASLIKRTVPFKTERVNNITPNQVKLSAYNKGFAEEFKRLSGIEKQAAPKTSLVTKILNPFGDTERMAMAAKLIKERGISRVNKRLLTLQHKSSIASMRKSDIERQLISNEKSLRKAEKPGIIEKFTGIGKNKRIIKQKQFKKNREGIAADLLKARRSHGAYKGHINVEGKLIKKRLRPIIEEHAKAKINIGAREFGNIATKAALAGGAGYGGYRIYKEVKKRQAPRYQ